MLRRTYSERHAELRLGENTRAGILDEITRSEHALEHGDSSHFARGLQPCEHWRMYSEFSDRAAFLDIETTGLGYGGDYVTVVGVHDGEGTRCYVRGARENGFEGTKIGGDGIQVLDISEFARDVTEYGMLVTFNGSQFDLPFLRREFEGIELPAAHLDLRFMLRRLGYSGGLKRIEPEFGLSRPDEIGALGGYDAVLLWKAHLRGNTKALDKLLRYNACDIEGLRVLADTGASMMEGRVRNRVTG